MEKQIKHRRNKRTLDKEVMAALEGLIVENGFEKIQLQTLCKRAKITPNTFYRNYGDMDTLLKRFVSDRDFWLNNTIRIADLERLGGRKFSAATLKRLYKELQTNGVMQQMLLWSLEDQDSIPQHFTRQREVESQYLTSYFEDAFKGSNVEPLPMLAVLVGGIYYTILRSRVTNSFVTLDFSQSAERSRFSKALESLVNYVYDAFEQPMREAATREAMKADGLSDEQIDRYIAMSFPKHK